MEILGRSRVYPWVVEMPALVSNAFKRGGGLPRAYLAVKLKLCYTYIWVYQTSLPSMCRSMAEGVDANALTSTCC